MEDSPLTVDILVVLINTLGLTELVSDVLTSRKQKEQETNTKIVDLFKDALDEIKNCRTEQQRVEFHIALDCNACQGDTGQQEWMDKNNLRSSGLETRQTI